MAFFKFRKGVDESASAPAQAQSVDAIRRRAKYRLVGAAVLVLVGVIGLPLLFDKQPRPIAVDTPIDIPDKNKVLPLVIPASPTQNGAINATNVASDVTDKAPVKPIPALDSSVITESAEPPTTAGKPAKKTASAQIAPAQSAAKLIAKGNATPGQPVANPVAQKPAEAARAQALLDGVGAAGKTADVKAPESKEAAVQPASGEGRFVVQVGAFADVTRAREARLKVEHAGMKTYTQVAETKDGRRIRVRVGPFATKAEADKAAEKIKKLNLPAALLKL